MTDEEFFAFLTPRLDPENPIDPSSEMYVPLYKDDRRDAIDLIENDIVRSGPQSVNFLSGFRGCGKSTELGRLRRQLLDRRPNAFVGRTDMMDFLLPSEPVHITYLLIALAAAFGESIRKEIGSDVLRESYWERFARFLTQTGVRLEGADFGVQTGLGISANLKTALRHEPSFREQVREKLKGRLGELSEDVHAFCADCVRCIKENKGQGPSDSIVFIVDQLEQIRDYDPVAGRIYRSFRELVADHKPYLEIPSVHMVYTMPPWLRFLRHIPNLHMLYNLKLWENDSSRSLVPSVLDQLRSLVEKRLTPEGFRRFFPDVNSQGVSPFCDRLIHASGGHLRDLILLVRSCAHYMRTLPIDSMAVSYAIDDMRINYLQLPQQDREWLAQVARDRNNGLKTGTEDEIDRFTAFLDTHCILIMRNGDEWYDVHPIVREALTGVSPAPVDKKKSARPSPKRKSPSTRNKKK